MLRVILIGVNKLKTVKETGQTNKTFILDYMNIAKGEIPYSFNS